MEQHPCVLAEGRCSSSAIYRFENVLLTSVKFTRAHIRTDITPHRLWLSCLRHSDSCVFRTILRPPGPSGAPRWQLMVECRVHDAAPLLRRGPLPVAVSPPPAANLISWWRQLVFWRRYTRWGGRGARSRPGRGAATCEGPLDHGDDRVLHTPKREYHIVSLEGLKMGFKFEMYSSYLTFTLCLFLWFPCKSLTNWLLFSDSLICIAWCHSYKKILNSSPLQHRIDTTVITITMVTNPTIPAAEDMYNHMSSWASGLEASGSVRNRKEFISTSVFQCLNCFMIQIKWSLTRVILPCMFATTYKTTLLFLLLYEFNIIYILHSGSKHSAALILLLYNSGD